MASFWRSYGRCGAPSGEAGASQGRDEQNQHHGSEELPEDRVAELRGHCGSREATQEYRQHDGNRTPDPRDILALKTPGGSDARNENAQAIGSVGLEGRQSQEDQEGNRQHGSATRQGVDHAGGKAAAHEEYPGRRVHGDLGKQPAL